MGFKLVSVLTVLTSMAAVICADDALAQISRSNERFSAKIYEALKTDEGNILVSPISLQTVFALVQVGAKGDTSNEIQKTLSLPTDKSTVQNGIEKLMSILTNAKNVQMDIANSVYVKTGYQVTNNFKQIARKSFAAEIENIDFSKPSEAANHINQWVEKKTHNRIKDLISPGSLDPLTRMILVNALYFKGMWKTQFHVSATEDRDFYVNGNKPVKVPMMSTVDDFKYAENEELDCKFLEMPYTGGEYAMTVVLPNKRDGLRALENRIGEVLKSQNYGMLRVQVSMPKFKVENTIHFTDVLKNMGMIKPFADADFSGLLDTPENLSISDCVQKNFIEVTEEGTEAASASAVGVVTLSLPSAPPRNIPFIADHPFLFIVRLRQQQPQNQFKNRFQYLEQYRPTPVYYNNQQPADTILFVGRFTNL